MQWRAPHCRVMSRDDPTGSDQPAPCSGASGGLVPSPRGARASAVTAAWRSHRDPRRCMHSVLGVGTYSRREHTLESDEIEALERRGWEALSGPKWGAILRRGYGRRWPYGVPGLIMDKQAALRAIRHAESWSTFELSDVCAIASEGAGRITYKAISQSSGQPQYEAVMSSRPPRSRLETSHPPTVRIRLDGVDC